MFRLLVNSVDVMILLHICPVGLRVVWVGYVYCYDVIGVCLCVYLLLVVDLVSGYFWVGGCILLYGLVLFIVWI